MTSVVGYARVPTHEQSPEAQEAELRAVGAQRVFVDTMASRAVSLNGPSEARA